MRFLAPFLAVALLCAASPPASAQSRPAERPVVVELYTAQGCQVCTKANGLADELSQRAGVLPLTFPVDYWDNLGWTDTFAKPEFTVRQRAYMRPLGQRDVYTPQVVVDGHLQASGARADKVDALIRDAAKAHVRGPSLRFYGGGFVRVDAGRAPKGGADLWLLRYDPHPDPVEVKDGENRGQTLGFANVVREAVRLGAWSGRRKTIALPKNEDAKLKTAILLQGANGGRILGVLER